MRAQRVTRRSAVASALLPVAALALLAGCSSTSGDVAAGTAGGTASSTPAGTPAAGAASGTGRPDGAASPTKPATKPAPSSAAATRPTAPATSTASKPVAGPAVAAAGDQTSVLNRLPGSASSSCATVGTQTDVRSGSLAVGNFAEARAAVAKGAANGAEVSFYVVPADGAAMPGVRLKATSPTGAVRTVSSTQVEQADTWYYYRVALPVRDRGSWRLEFTAGGDTGCYRVTF